METEPFNPAAWAAQHLDILHPPSCEAYRSITKLSIRDLKRLYQLLCGNYSFPDWPCFVWDTFADMLERELALEL